MRYAEAQASARGLYLVHNREIIKKNAVTVTSNVQSNGDGPDYDGDNSIDIGDAN